LVRGLSRLHYSIRLERVPHMVLDKRSIYGLNEVQSRVSPVATWVGVVFPASRLSGRVRRPNCGDGRVFREARCILPGFLLDRAARGSIGPRRLADARLAVASLVLILFGLALSPPGAAQDLRSPAMADVAGAASAKSSAPAAAARRVALIIANGAYPDAPLANPTIDSGLIADSLNRIGFAVTVKENLDLDGFEQAISDFAETAKGADLALFYFSGHGFSVASGGLQQNLLMATSANFKAKTTLALQQGGEPLEHVEETIIGHARATLIFIDACRNVPALATRGVGSRGFAPIDRSALEGAYVVLSTREGKTAADGEAGQGSPARSLGYRSRDYAREPAKGVSGICAVAESGARPDQRPWPWSRYCAPPQRITG